jgi:hypothetical protein
MLPEQKGTVTVKFFSQPFLTSENDIDYYGCDNGEFLHLENYEWDNSLKLMKVPIMYVFISGFEKFGSMIGGLHES